MMGECRAKGRGTRCPAEVGKVQHRILQVKWGGWDSQTQSRCKWIHEISYEGLWGVLPASPDEGWGSGYGQAGRHRVGLAAQLWLSFTPSLQPLGRISAAVLSSQRGYPMAGEIPMMADNCRQAAMALSWILQLRTSPCPQVFSWPSDGLWPDTSPLWPAPNWMLEG